LLPKISKNFACPRWKRDKANKKEHQKMKQVIRGIFNTFGYDIISKRRSDEIKSTEDDFLKSLSNLHYKNGGRRESKSQLKQDLFALLETSFKRSGFFIEFGATNGIDLSNTWLLEKDYGWAGILAEPATIWHEDLHKNRDVKIETDCVWKVSGEKLRFNMTPNGEFSTVEEFSSSDMHKNARRAGKRFEVNTISLTDLLTKHNAPHQIDYLSIDTEGSEFDIINAFDFSGFQVDVITIEHNYTSSRQKIYDLLISKGYQRKYEGLSKFDDWYVRIL
jgi:FkbM family methyltransferase